MTTVLDQERHCGNVTATLVVATVAVELVVAMVWLLLTVLDRL